MSYRSLIFWLSLSFLFVFGAYILNSAVTYPYTGSASVLASVTTTSNEKVPKEHGPLTSLADRRAKDMVLNQYYAHESLSGTFFYDQFYQVGLSDDSPACENLLLMTSGLTKEQVNREWEKSPPHKKCLDTNHNTYGYAERVFDPMLDISVYVYIAASL